jgi:hypothetical protein
MEQTGALPGRLRGTAVACTYLLPVPGGARVMGGGR